MLFIALATIACGFQEPALFEEPFQLAAGGTVIDTGHDIAHSGPLWSDLDGDGLGDLLVGNFRGLIHVYRNTGTRAAPRLEERGPLSAEGETVKIHNW